ncbi:TonB-dependent receptor [candidate division KSB1 bacterium]|nr:TonB-dependent receptor [candidate division KSB1 bacterium]
MKRLTGIVAVVLFCRLCFAVEERKDGSIQGQVVDEATSSPLPSVNIIIQDTQRGASSDPDGFFSILGVPPGAYNLKCMMIGYKTRILNNVIVNPGRSIFIKIELKSTILEADSIVVTAGFFHEAKDAVVSNRSMDFEEIRSDPGSAEDIQRVVQALPAVVSGSDQDNEIIVRGGMPGENLFVMDEVEILNPNHFGYQGTTGGPINMINTYMVRRVDFYAGAFPARYGDKASSVMDIALRDGNREKIAGHGYMGMAGVGAMLEGPIPGRKGSFILSARKSYLDLVIDATGLTAVPYYYSLQGKAVYDLNKNNKLTIHGIFGDDKITIEDDESGYGRGAENVRSKSYQYAAGMTLRTLLGGMGLSKFTLSQSSNTWDQYVYHGIDDPYYTNVSIETERTLKYDLTYLPVKKLETNVGAHIKAIHFDIDEWAEADTIYTWNTGVSPPVKTGIYQFYGDYINSADERTYKSAAWAQLKWMPGRRLTLSGGLRFDHFSYTGQSALDPRLGLSVHLSPSTQVNLAYGQHSQSPPYIQLGMHPANKTLDYKKTRQVVLGLERLFREDIRGTVEVFYKEYSDVPISVSSLTPDPFDRSDGELVNKGEGYAQGIEFFLQKKLDRNYHFTLSYSFSDSKGLDPRFNEYYPWDYDYRHVFTFINGYKFHLMNKKWYQKLNRNFIYNLFAWILPFGDQVEVSVRWRYLGGRPHTEPVYYPNLQRWLSDETVRYNQTRYPSYHRLDFRLDRRFMFNGWNLVTFFDIMNIYGRDNIWGYSYNDDGTYDTVYQYSLFPVGGVTVEF